MRSKQISFTVTEKLHRALKIAAAMRNITMNKFIEDAILKELEKQAQEHEK